MKYRDTEKMTAAVEKIVKILEGHCDSKMLQDLLEILEQLPTEGMTRKQLWRIGQAKSDVLQQLNTLSSESTGELNHA